MVEFDDFTDDRFFTLCDGRSHKISEYQANAPWYLRELIDDINNSKSFAELRGRRPRLAGLGEKLAFAAGYSAKSCISQFKEAVKRRLFICFCRNVFFHMKLFYDVSLNERFNYISFKTKRLVVKLQSLRNILTLFHIHTSVILKKELSDEPKGLVRKFYLLMNDVRL